MRIKSFPFALSLSKGVVYVCVENEALKRENDEGGEKI
jgi:hypothetical protein